jgi:hypothetical protein
MNSSVRTSPPLIQSDKPLVSVYSYSIDTIYLGNNKFPICNDEEEVTTIFHPCVPTSMETQQRLLTPVINAYSTVTNFKNGYVAHGAYKSLKSFTTNDQNNNSLIIDSNSEIVPNNLEQYGSNLDQKTNGLVNNQHLYGLPNGQNENDFSPKINCFSNVQNQLSVQPFNQSVYDITNQCINGMVNNQASVSSTNNQIGCDQKIN